MIVQVSTVIVPESNLDEYLDYAQANEVPEYGVASGLTWVCLLQRRFVAFVEVTIISAWESEEALSEFAEGRTRPEGIKTRYGVVAVRSCVTELVLFSWTRCERQDEVKT